MMKVGIIGAGAWGSALAIAVARAGREVLLRAHESDVVEFIKSSSIRNFVETKLEENINGY